MRLVQLKGDGLQNFSRTVLRRWLRKRESHGAAQMEDAAPVGGAAAAGGTSWVAVRGRKVDHEFESNVLEHLVYTTLERVSSDAEVAEEPHVPFKTAYARVAATCMHSYAVIRKAAEVERDALQVGHPVRQLTFSDKWVHNFLLRFRFSRQVITKVLRSNKLAASLSRARAH
jgi:hypothetical protein